MNDKVQRVPRGLLELLSLQGGRTPMEIEEAIRGSLDLLQFYGLTQLQSLGLLNAAAAEGTGVSIVPSATAWTVLFGATVTITKTATMTALRGGIAVNRTGGGEIIIAQQELGPFGATDTGSVSVGGYVTYPLLLPPGSVVVGRANVIGTDATANVITIAEFGVLG